MMIASGASEKRSCGEKHETAEKEQGANADARDFGRGTFFHEVGVGSMGFDPGNEAGDELRIESGAGLGRASPSESWQRANFKTRSDTAPED